MDLIKKINKLGSVYEILPELSEDELADIIKIASDHYYNSDTPVINDKVFDILIERLKYINPNSPVFDQIGAPIKGKKAILPYWMGSMDKIKDDDKKFKKFISQYHGPYVVSDKLDGISCLLTIDNGVVNLYTRGDGTKGQLITHLLDFVNMSIDKLLMIKDRKIAIRGELVMPKKKFEKYAKTMSNARSMTAGIVTSKKESINKKHAADVDYVAYEIIEPHMLPSEQFAYMKKLGLNVVYHDVYDYIDTNILHQVLEKRKKKSIYEIDGIIVTDDNKHARNKSGNPPYSFAFKELTETADVKVIEVLWNPSKDGLLIPRIHYETTRLSQADLNYTLGFNAKFIVDNKIGPGAIITIVRSGEVIPYIMGVVKPASKPSLPDMDYHWDKNKVNIILDNANDNETVIIRRLTKFIQNIGVENLSEGNVSRLVRAGFDTIPKLISLTVKDLLSIEGFQKTLATKIYKNLQAALDKLDILTLMVASNIFGRGFGETKIKKILIKYPNIVDLYSKKTHDKLYDKILALEGFDTITATNFLSGLANFQIFYKKITKLIDVKPYVDTSNKNGIFSNKTIAFSGFRDAQWKKFIEEEGGTVSESVSKNTSLLVYNDGEETTGKYLTAIKNKIPTMTKSAFSKKYNIQSSKK